MSGLPKIFGSRTLPWVLLALSLALNAFFLGGHVYGRVHHRDFAHYEADRARYLGEQLGLSDTQIAAFRQMREKTRDLRRNVFGSNREHRTAMWAELAKEQPDQAEIDRRLEAMTNAWLTYQREKIALTREFIASLSAEQRTKYFELAEQRSKRWARRWRSKR